MAGFRLGNDMKGNWYWKKEEERMCRACGNELETWEHIWEECGGWNTEGSWQEMIGVVLGEDW